MIKLDDRSKYPKELTVMMSDSYWQKLEHIAMTEGLDMHQVFLQIIDWAFEAIEI
jgi:hypothetical protein